MDVLSLRESSSPGLLPVVPCLVDEGTTFPFTPCKFHSTTVESGLCAGGYHRCFQDGNASFQGKHLALLLVAHVYGKWEGSVDAGVEFNHVVVDFRLEDCSVGGGNVGDKVVE